MTDHLPGLEPPPPPPEPRLPLVCIACGRDCQCPSPLTLVITDDGRMCSQCRWPGGMHAKRAAKYDRLLEAGLVGADVTTYERGAMEAWRQAETL